MGTNAARGRQCYIEQIQSCFSLFWKYLLEDNGLFTASFFRCAGPALHLYILNRITDSCPSFETAIFPPCTTIKILPVDRYFSILAKTSLSSSPSYFGCLFRLSIITTKGRRNTECDSPSGSREWTIRRTNVAQVCVGII